MNQSKFNMYQHRTLALGIYSTQIKTDIFYHTSDISLDLDGQGDRSYGRKMILITERLAGSKN